MEGVNIPFLPTTLWLLAGATSVLVLLVALGYYIYWQRRAAALVGEAGDVATLATKKQMLEAEVSSLRQWMTDQKAELDRLTAEREEQERLRALLADLENQCATKDQENQGLRKEVGELENRRHELTSTCEKLEREIGNFESKRAEAEVIEKRLAEMKGKIEEAQKAVNGLAEAQAKMQALIAEKVSLEDIMEGHRSAAETARKEAAQQKQEAERNRHAAELAILDLTEAQKIKNDLVTEVNELRQKQSLLAREIKTLEERHNTLKGAIKTLTDEAKKATEAAKKARANAAQAESELLIVTRERARLEVMIDELGIRKVALEKDVSNLEGRLGPITDDGKDRLSPYNDLLNVIPSCLVKDTFLRERDKQDEAQILQQVRNALRQEGLLFSQRVIDAFHTSLKCHAITPITVLAGVSGTGKTLLPMRYAEIIGMHRLVMAIQPRWDAPQDMFGFYNYLEKKYRATDLSRSLLRMDPYNYKGKEFSGLDSGWAKNRLLLILLDEMNLARTEYYFSEFLSKLELRREVKDPSLANKRSQAEIELDVGPGGARFRIWVPYNIFFVGTMNEDETTQTLSDKVLDRANVIRFGKPDERAKAAKYNAESAVATDKFLSESQWRSWQRKFDESEEWFETVVGWTRRLNLAMDRIGRPFGFRVHHAIGHYVANYPQVDDGERFKLAFADQLEQKIIPKLRGIRLGESNAEECLSDVEAIITELSDNELSSAFEAARKESESLGSFQWRGVTRSLDEDNL